MKWQSKPKVIDAWPVDHLLSFASSKWSNLPQEVRDAYENGDLIFLADGISVKTLEGSMRANYSDFLIRGIQGEFYPCKRDIFLASYSQIEDEPTT